MTKKKLNKSNKKIVNSLVAYAPCNCRCDCSCPPNSTAVATTDSRNMATTDQSVQHWWFN